MVYSIQHYVRGQLFSPDTVVSSTNKTDRHDVSEILVKVALSIINQAYQYIVKYNEVIPETHHAHSVRFLPLLRRFNPAEPVVEKSVIL